MDEQTQNQAVIEEHQRAMQETAARQAMESPNESGQRNMVSRGLQAVGDTGDDAVGATRRVIKGAISATEDVGGDLVNGVAHLAQHVIHGVRDVGSEAGIVIREGANGTVSAVGDIGGNTVHTLTNLIVDLVGGVRQIAGAAVSSARRDQVVSEASPSVIINSENEVAAPPPAGVQKVTKADLKH